MKLLRSNDWQYRLLRTIIQGVIGVLVANLDLLISKLTFDPTLKPMIAALVMAVLSPVMAEIGKADMADDQDDDYFIMDGDGSGKGH